MVVNAIETMHRGRLGNVCMCVCVCVREREREEKLYFKQCGQGRPHCVGKVPTTESYFLFY